MEFLEQLNNYHLLKQDCSMELYNQKAEVEFVSFYMLFVCF